MHKVTPLLIACQSLRKPDFLTHQKINGLHFVHLFLSRRVIRVKIDPNNPAPLSLFGQYVDIDSDR